GVVARHLRLIHGRQTTAGMQLVCIVTPQTSGERSHASPLTTPVTGPSFVQAPISLLAVPMSAGTSDILDSFTCGLVLNPSNVCAAVMNQRGSPFDCATPVQ